MVRTRSPPLVIIEADAAWDVNIRGIMGLANEQLIRYLTESGSTATDAPFYAREKQHHPQGENRTVEYDPDDPWQSQHWDVIGLGHCTAEPAPFDPDNYPPMRIYRDDFNPPSVLGKNRKLYRSVGWACTTGYAVSHRGAAKLLLKLALSFHEPVDLIIAKMIDAGELISYVINPGPIVQWEYHPNIGMGPGANSDLSRLGGGDEGYKDDGSGWEEVRKTHSAWVMSDKFHWVKFKRPALGESWNTIFSGGPQFTMPEIPGIGQVLGLTGLNATRRWLQTPD